ncbi:MAG: alpha/beta hydrolase fold domain-containing protein [Hydrogenophaga sp.]|uniref:alpha/beta hydrolase n=1 Tax=Hydrogenophaga sp. TaxID=1904254 RepID=UPI0016969129|nr:alpha/beta hydrolase [Hydrogenophaga sp.]NIM42871.1 alpha/beta hydrolase fold domain-containing protein [Hydrogenophaga sp.]NIN27804.1 alpha/beta hydrolase fold domain-containing protein [Hydrogenophaga sp.]NIN32623.1 alpha/beta hydrolase fold domain-containing protein [Hydrogenophaga sp.]NIN57077.1 alpha/beta hydrolase fold domain-containing protein [Hydrogenophaga sp.]NIO53488.1 alpha/beta hydrolase fold domain-containing protein [Hydrogenophaga sp.]
MSHHPDPRARLTPAMRGVIDRIARAGHPPFHSLTPERAREAYAAGAGVLEVSPPAMARTQDLRIPTRDGAELPARLFLPTEAHGLPVLLYFHGGGFTIGSVATHEPLCRTLAHLAGCAVLSVDYRLAPERKFPGAVHDAWDSLAWLRDAAGALDLDPARIAVGGDSAGGTLAIATALQARDAGWPLALQLLFYPGCAGHQDTPSHRTYAHGFILDEPNINYFFGHYLRSPADRDDWRFAPLDGRDERGEWKELDGAAPVWMGLAECDPLVDEGVAFCDRLRLAGVPVDLEIYAGVVHNFVQFGRAIPEARKAHQHAARALKNAFGGDD